MSLFPLVSCALASLLLCILLEYLHGKLTSPAPLTRLEFLSRGLSRWLAIGAMILPFTLQNFLLVSAALCLLASGLRVFSIPLGAYLPFFRFRLILSEVWRLWFTTGLFLASLLISLYMLGFHPIDLLPIT